MNVVFVVLSPTLDLDARPVASITPPVVLIMMVVAVCVYNCSWDSLWSTLSAPGLWHGVVAGAVCVCVASLTWPARTDEDTKRKGYMHGMCEPYVRFPFGNM